jgi:hypothetical protein
MSMYWAAKEARMERAKDEAKRKPKKQIPELLDKITDVVLAYRPTPKSKGGKKRVRKAKKAKADAQER